MIRLSSLKINGTVENCENINIILGPNNSGKTAFLDELGGALQTMISPKSYRWIKGARIESDDLLNICKSIVPKSFNTDNPPTISHSEFRTLSRSSPEWDNHIFKKCQKLVENKNEIFNIKEQPENDEDFRFWKFLSPFFLSVELCRNRLRSEFTTSIGNLNQQIENDIIGYLFFNRNELKKIQKNVKEVFNLTIGFDDLEMGTKILRILPTPKIKGDKRSPETEKEWNQKSPSINEQGDGVKAYLNTIFCLLPKYKFITIIDEPESFLHPPQRRALGNLIAKEKNKQIFAATHDSEFLRGVLSSNTENIKIFYLKQKNKEFTYKAFDANDIKALTKGKTNLWTERILNSFFYKKTILTEYEDDRVFYETASALYWWDNYQETNFIGLSGKVEVIKLFEELTKFDLNMVAIVDIDYLFDGIFPNNINDSSLKQKFNDLKSKFGMLKNNDNTFKNKFKKQGIEYIKNNEPHLFIDLEFIVNELKKNNIFIVPVGQLESFTNSTHRDIRHALNIIQQSRKMKLSKFLKEILTN